MVYTFTVPMLPPASQSPNARYHWGRKARDRKEYMEQVARAILVAGLRLKSNLSGVVVDVELVYAYHRRRDGDNFSIMWSKPVLDALVRLGFLKDDSVEHVTVLSPKITVDRARAPRTIVTLTEVASG